MNGKGVWVLAAAILLGFALVSFSQQTPWTVTPPAEHEAKPEMPSQVLGHYQVVRASSEEIVILETTTGGLYRAERNEIKPYKERRGMLLLPMAAPQKKEKAS